MDQTKHFHLNNNTLILENVTAKDEGVFVETVVLRNGTTKCLNFKLIIQHPPSVTEIVVSWTSNTSVTLKCKVSGSFLHLMWKREGVPILEKHRHSLSEENQTLHISNITNSDYGTYSCTASNAYGESETHTNITSENSTVNQETGTSGKTDHTVLLSGLTLTGVLGLRIMLYCLHKYHHRQRVEKCRTTDEGDADNVHGIYKVSAAAQHFEDFGYSCREETAVLYCVTNDQPKACPDAGEDK
ncbi:hemicentin-1-like [Labeo rohita]|uniref:hemicentin-1-like n=1 Tax=Labeo rohita TaxID=84645 RepID=UPI0021E2F637|nr:hemicentin-1-like [Labeo rohita]